MLSSNYIMVVGNIMCKNIKNMEYPEDNLVTVLGSVCTKTIYAHSNHLNQVQDLNLGASGNVILDTDAMEFTGDTIFNSNVVINSSMFIGDLNIFRTFDDGHTISYGMRISDDEKLQFYKNDSRVNKSVVVNEFGRGVINDNNKVYNETSTVKVDRIFNKAKLVGRKTG